MNSRATANHKHRTEGKLFNRGWTQMNADCSKARRAGIFIENQNPNNPKLRSERQKDQTETQSAALARYCQPLTLDPGHLTSRALRLNVEKK